MAAEWLSSTWGNEISLEYGRALRSYDPNVGQYRVFGSNGPIGWHGDFLVAGPGVILGRKGAYRGVEFWPDPFFVIDTAYYVVSKNDNDMRWLYYAIKHHKLGDIDDGSPIPSTTRAAVYPRELDVPPPPNNAPSRTSLARWMIGLRQTGGWRQRWRRWRARFFARGSSPSSPFAPRPRDGGTPAKPCPASPPVSTTSCRVS